MSFLTNILEWDIKYIYVRIYILLQYYLNQTSLNFGKCKFCLQSKALATLYQQVRPLLVESLVIV